MSTTGIYPPSDEFVRKAHVKGMEGYRELYRRAEQDPEAFWGDLAAREIRWFEPWKQVLDWKPPFVQWFVGAKTNISYNCLDRHATTHRKNKVAILWEGEPGEQRSITYQELLRLVSRFANVLKSRGYQAGDRSIIYMPMIPELPIAMLACARLGITHSVVFGGFSAEALKARIQDLGATVVITADGGYRRGKEVKLKPAVDEALTECPGVRDVIVYRRTGSDTAMQAGRDSWWQDLDAALTGPEAERCPAVPLDSEHPLLCSSSHHGNRRVSCILPSGTRDGHHEMGLRFEAKNLLVLGRYWMVTGQLHRYGPLGGRDDGDVRCAGLPAVRPRWQLVEEVSRQYTTPPTAIRALIRQGVGQRTLRVCACWDRRRHQSTAWNGITDHRQRTLPD
jgi:acetyl-CoA synthetase